MKPCITINSRQIGPDFPAYIIAEMSANHNQSYEDAVKIIHAAKQAGADAIKLQTYTPDTITINSDKEYFRVGQGTLWEGQTLYDLYGTAYTPWEWFPKLKQIADDVGIDFFSSPFDFTAVDFLEKLGVPAYKIASFEIIDIPLIRYIAKTGKPIIMSTGMATLAEIDAAVRTVRSENNDKLALLKCTSAYPSPPEEMNLRTIPHLAKCFQVPAGLSDHTLGITIPIAAVAQQACIVEKHFTLSRNNESPDSAFSLEPDELKNMVTAIRDTEKALGQVSYDITPEQKNCRDFRRSLFVVKNVKKGEAVSHENVRSIRPGNGLPPRYLDQVIGRNFSQDAEKGTPLNWELL